MTNHSEEIPQVRSWRITFLSAAGIPVQWAIPSREARRRIRAWQAVQAALSGPALSGSPVEETP